MAMEAVVGLEGRNGAAGGHAPDAAGRDPLSLASTRLTRELIAADARSDLDVDDEATRASRLIEVARSGLRLSVAAVMRRDGKAGGWRCLAAHALSAPALELLESTSSGGSTLVQRACNERRVFLLDRASREPLMSALRSEVSEVTTAAVVPLYDRGRPVASLVLAAAGSEWLHASSLRLLAPAFHLLGVLLAPGRGALGIATAANAGAGSPAAGSELERYAVEVEELGSLLREARESARLSAERASTAEAAHRADVGALRARVAELEATASGDEVERTVLRELERTCDGLRRRVQERDSRIAALEQEIRDLSRRLEEIASGRGGASLAGFEVEAIGRMTGTGAESTAGGDENPLEVVAASALGEIGASGGNGDAAGEESPDHFLVADDGDETERGTSAPESGADPVAVVDDGIAEAAAPIHLLLLDPRDPVRVAGREAAGRTGASFWDGESPLPPAARRVIAVNLLDGDLRRVVELEGGSDRCQSFAYVFDSESESGFELGRVGWIPRPIDALDAVARIRRESPGKISGVLLISGQIRELAGLRERLAAAGLSASVACDGRQAQELLEIVRRPDAVLVDLALDGGQGISVAAQFRAQPETRDLPLLFLLPAEIDSGRLAADARRAAILRPYGLTEVSRLITAALAHHGS